jgi:osmotically inducible protein OsmC
MPRGAVRRLTLYLLLDGPLARPRPGRHAADVTFQPGTGITGIALSVVGTVPGITAEQFEEAAQAAKTDCPVSQALSAVPITLETSFTG